MSLDIFELKVYAILPVLILLCGALCLLLINVFSSVFSRGLNVALSALFLGVSSIFSLNLKVGSSFFGLININGIGILGQFSMEICALIFIVLFGANAGANALQKLDCKEFFDKSFLSKEFYPLFLLMIAGFDIMVSSTHLVVILLGLEIGSLSLCVLIALNGRSKGIEAGIKYFVMGVLASVFFIFGVVCLYFACASMDIAHIHDMLLDDKYTSVFALFGGLVFILSAIAFKASAVPFHSWMPDIYEGSNSIMAGVVSIIPKIAAFSVAITLLGAFLKVGIIWLESAMYVLVVLTITLPNIAALIQNDVKRMLAFSSISHSGFVLACVMIGTQISLSALYLYWFMFIITNIGTFGLLWLKELKSPLKSSLNLQDSSAYFDSSEESKGVCSEPSAKSNCKCAKIASKIQSLVKTSAKTPYDIPFSAFNGLVRTSPLKAFLGVIFMLSLAGIPPFGVFWGKLLAIMSAYSGGFVGLALIMMINSAIAGFYYLRLVVAMFLLDSKDSSAIATKSQVANSQVSNDEAGNFAHCSTLGKIIVGIMGVLCVGSIFMAQFLLDFIGKYVIGAY